MILFYAAATGLPHALSVPMAMVLEGAGETVIGLVTSALPPRALSAVATTMLPPALSVLRDTAQLGAMMTVCGKVEDASMLLVNINTRMIMEA